MKCNLKLILLLLFNLWLTFDINILIQVANDFKEWLSKWNGKVDKINNKFFKSCIDKDLTIINLISDGKTDI